MKSSSYFTLGARNSLDFPKLSQWEEEKQSPERDQDIQLNKPQYGGPKAARFPQQGGAGLWNHVAFRVLHRRGTQEGPSIPISQLK